MTTEPSSADPEAPATEGQSPGRWRVAAQRALLGVACGALLASAVPAAALFPYLRDDRSLDVVVRVVALDWRDFGADTARARLQYELDHRGIGMWVRDEDCRLEQDGDVREVACEWRVGLPVPGTALAIPLRFASRAVLTPAGDLVASRPAELR